MLNGKSVLITGGTGTFGHAMTRAILEQYEPRRLIIFSRGELKQSQMRASFQRPCMRWFIGDVRDLQRLLQAFDGVDVVFHAAALKQVPTCEYNPFEAVKTNVFGAMNVIEAAIARDAGAVIAISSDKACLDYSAGVELASDETVAIRDMVVSRGTADVRSWDGNKFVDAKVTGWYKNHLEERRMIKLILQHPLNEGTKYERGLHLTEDHLVLTPQGWVAAGLLKTGDVVTTSEPAPNEKQTSLIVGILLGDASVGSIHFKNPKHGNPKTYLHTGHSEKQLEWLEIEYRALSEFAVRAPHLERPGNRGGGKRSPFWILRFKSLRCFTDLRNSFYKDGLKIVPRELVERYFGPEMMAAWYMDDGTYVPNGNGSSTASVRLETQGFVEDDVRWLADLLTRKGFPARAYMHTVAGKQYWQTRLPTKSAALLFEYVGRFVPPALRYKLPATAPAYDAGSWEVGAAVPYTCPVIVEEGKQPKRDVYCIDVADTHNFCAGGFIVHNCSPSNIYGATKMCMERLFVNSTAYVGSHKTILGLVRYGNVAGSRGSVAHVFEAQKASGEVTITDPEMTRFWFTIEEAVAFTLARLEDMTGGEIFVPKIPSARIVDVAEAIALGCKVRTVGVRPGEKMHETLITHGECAIDCGSYYVIAPSGSLASLGMGTTEYRSDTNSEWVTVEEIRRWWSEYKDSLQ